MIKPINEVITEKNIIIPSPHYDDAILTFGGYLNKIVVEKLIHTKNIRVINIFSRSNYQARDDEGNAKMTLDRVKFATGKRLLEDLDCLDELMGHGNYTYELKAELEALLRFRGWKPGEAFEFPQGDRDSFTEDEWKIYHRIKKSAIEWLASEDTAILLALSMKEHIDHVITREAIIDAKNELGDKMKAVIYIGEDQPYTGLAEENDWKKADIFLNQFKTEKINYKIDVSVKVDLVFKHYVSQVEESYRQGVLNRSAYLQNKYGTKTGVERIYKLVL